MPLHSPHSVALHRDRIAADLGDQIAAIPKGDPQHDVKVAAAYAFHFGRLLGLLDMCVEEGVSPYPLSPSSSKGG